MQPRPRIAHEPALDGIRGAAVAAVLLFHAGHLRGGYLGVDLFFTLSGFLITSLLLAEVGSTNAVRLGAFWARRARRLLPALAILFVGVALYAWFVARPNELDQIRWDGVWTAFYAANWRAVLAKANYWALFQSPSPFQHTWSLAIEEQFYLVWPIVMFIVARKSRDARDAARTTLLIASTIAVLGSAWLIFGYDPTHASRSYFGTDTRIASIAFGAALAALVMVAPRARSLPIRARAGAQALGWIGVLAIGVLWNRLDGLSDRLYRGGLTVAAIAATCVIAAVITQRDGVLSRALSFPPLRALGLISYGVYLYHWPIYVWLTPARTHQTGWTLTGIRVALTLTVATLSYFYVERPVRRGVGARRTIAILGPAVAGLTALSLLATTAGAHPIVDVAAGKLNDTIKVTKEAARAPKGTYRVMLAGSSIAAILAGPIRSTRESRHIILLNRAFIGCAFPDGITRSRAPGESPNANPFSPCGDTWRHDVDLFKPEAVLYIPGSEPGDAAYEFHHSGHFVDPCTPAYDDVYRYDLMTHLTTLIRPGTTVYLTTFAYTALPFIAPHWYKNTDCVNRIIRNVAHTTHGVALIDLAHFMCTHIDAPCTYDIGGKLVRPDGTHYSGPGALPVARWLLAQMRLSH